MGNELFTVELFVLQKISRIFPIGCIYFSVKILKFTAIISLAASTDGLCNADSVFFCEV
jgi:hypothetical protein